MNYRPNKRRFGPLWLLLGVWVVGFVWYNQLSSLALGLARPVWRVVGAFGAQASTASTEVNQELAKLRGRLLDYDALRAEQISLRAVLGHYDSPAKIVAAKILSHPWRSPYDILLVDTGTENVVGRSLVVGNEVFVDNAVALGQVVAVADTTAKVKLFSAGGSELPVIVGPNRLPVIARGRGGGNFRAELPRAVAVSVGDAVRTIRGGRDLAVGAVGAVDKIPGASLQTIYFRYPFNLNELTLVEIQTL